MSDQANLPYSEVGSIPVLVDPHVPLTKIKRNADGSIIGETPALFWVIFGRIHVHPDRLEAFRLHITSSKRHPYVKAEAQ